MVRVLTRVLRGRWFEARLERECFRHLLVLSPLELAAAVLNTKQAPGEVAGLPE